MVLQFWIKFCLKKVKRQKKMKKILHIWEWLGHNVEEYLDQKFKIFLLKLGKKCTFYKVLSFVNSIM